MNISSILRNPYRPLFFLGTITAIIAAGLWIPYGFHFLDFYPGRMHAHLMMGVFLLSFASGFLMTAIPKMTGTFPSSKIELTIQLISLILATIFGLINEESNLFFMAMLLNLIVLLFFVGKRFWVKQNDLPDVFPFVLAGIFSGVFGCILWIAGFISIGHRLFYLNFVLCLVVGVGSKLIPALLRLNPGKPNSKKVSIVLAAVLTLSCFVEDFEFWSLGPWARALAVVWVGIFYWRVFGKSNFVSGQTIGVRLSAFSVILGTILLAAFPDYRMEWVHLIYVSGFTLLTFMVASRVILAHGGFELRLEAKNWRISTAVGLILLAAATRAYAPFWPKGYERHLAYSAFCLVLAIIVWGGFFLPKLIVRDNFSMKKL